MLSFSERLSKISGLFAMVFYKSVDEFMSVLYSPLNVCRKVHVSFIRLFERQSKISYQLSEHLFKSPDHFAWVLNIYPKVRVS